MEIYLPKNVKFIINKMYDKGYEAFIVGGCVRDSILGIEPNDYDITTNASPDEIISIFKDYRIIDNGIKHGTVGVIIDKEVYEITTYRIEGEYENNRRPKDVKFTSSIIEDLKRRDFTINAIAYNDKIGIIDEFNGMKDIKSRIIKTVGNPDERFNEDGLRIIRAIRFSSKLDFKIENVTLNSIYKNAHIIKIISKERITDEFTKIILSENPQNITLLHKTGILKSMGIYLDINFYEYMQLKKELKVLNKCDDDLVKRLTMLEYVISYNYRKLKNEKDMLNLRVVDKFKYPKKTINDCKKILEYMFINIEEIDYIKIKLILSEIGQEKLKEVLELKKLYYNYCLKGKIDNDELNKNNEIINNCIRQIIKIQEKKECYTLKDLDIDGKDLRELGYSGKDIGDKLNLLLYEVIKNPKLNKKELLISLVCK